MSAGGGVVYLDSSALVKLVVPEPESAALRTELVRWQRQASSALARAEVIRACARLDPGLRPIADSVVGALYLVAVDDEILDEAAALPPAELRTLDAIHLATAIRLEATLGAVISYDQRLLDAARGAGLPVSSPI